MIPTDDLKHSLLSSFPITCSVYTTTHLFSFLNVCLPKLLVVVSCYQSTVRVYVYVNPRREEEEEKSSSSKHQRSCLLFYRPGPARPPERRRISDGSVMRWKCSSILATTSSSSSSILLVGWLVPSNSLSPIQIHCVDVSKTTRLQGRCGVFSSL